MSGVSGPVVLLVEDSAVMRTLIRSLVEEVTSAIHECDSGENAVDLYPDLRPDWVLMDIQLGGMDGIAATRAIRRLDTGARVIMVTEHGDAAHREKARAAGARAFVLKEDLLKLPTLLAASIEKGPEGG